MNSNHQTHEVGKRKSNGYGLYDMSGNVQEWVWDSTDYNTHYICSGHFDSYDDDNNRVEYSCTTEPDSADCSIGFRIVCNAE